MIKRFIYIAPLLFISFFIFLFFLFQKEKEITKKTEQIFQEQVIIKEENDILSKNSLIIPELGIKLVSRDEKFSFEGVEYFYEPVIEDPSGLFGYIYLSQRPFSSFSGCEDGSSSGVYAIVKGDFEKDSFYKQEVDSEGNDKHWSETLEGLRLVGAIQFEDFFVYYISPQGICASAEEDVSLFIQTMDKMREDGTLFNALKVSVEKI